MEDNQEGEKLKNGLIYGLNDEPPFKKHSSPPCNICLPYSLPSSHLPSLLPEH